MDINAYIESGILELYVAGSLSEKENKEVYDLMLEHPEILQEVLEIESAVIKLTASTSRGNKARILTLIKENLFFNKPNKQTKVVSIAKPKYNWLTYTGWAAAIILGVGLFWVEPKPTVGIRFANFRNTTILFGNPNSRCQDRFGSQ